MRLQLVQDGVLILDVVNLYAWQSVAFLLFLDCFSFQFAKEKLKQPIAWKETLEGLDIA
jgi:hypothetical protein